MGCEYYTKSILYKFHFNIYQRFINIRYEYILIFKSMMKLIIIGNQVMHQYKIYTNPLGIHNAVKEGWSWPAFFFSIIWAIIKKMLGIGIGVFIAFFLLGFIVGVSGAGSGGDALINIAAIITSIVFGINGNNWNSENLIKRGYNYKDTIQAENPEIAIALYIKENE